MRKRLRRFGGIVRKEMIQVLRDRRTLAIVLIIPLVELVLFAYAVDMTVDQIPTAVADKSLDSQSRALINALSASGVFEPALYVENEEEVVRAIDEGRVKAGIVIPPGFATHVQRRDAQVLILLDGSDSFIVQSGYSAAYAITQDRAMELLVQQVGGYAAGSGRLPVTTSTRILYNPSLDDLIFLMPALAAMLLQVLSVNLTAMAVARERELGTIEGLLITPIRPIELMISKMLPNVLISAIALLSVIVAGIAWFGVPFRGDPWLFAWVSLLFIVSGLGLGLLISTVSQTQHQAQQISMVFFMLNILLTGFLYPREPMPPLSQAVGGLIPLTYAIRLCRGIMTKGVGLSFLWSDVLAMGFYAAVVMILAATTFNKRLD
ncbi:MAG TPA: ABC transporter permease [Anaerolineae bacterium]|nr:ABC transporter permease [Anaerolineae bacterium]